MDRSDTYKIYARPYFASSLSFPYLAQESSPSVITDCQDTWNDEYEEIGEGRLDDPRFLAKMGRLMKDYERKLIVQRASETCVDPGGILANGISIGDENIGMSRYLARYMTGTSAPTGYEKFLNLPRLSASEKALLTQAYQTAYREALKQPDSPYGVLSEKATSLLKTKVQKRHEGLIAGRTELLENYFPFQKKRLIEVLTDLQQKIDTAYSIIKNNSLYTPFPMYAGFYFSFHQGIPGFYLSPEVMNDYRSRMWLGTIWEIVRFLDTLPDDILGLLPENYVSQTREELIDIANNLYAVQVEMPQLEWELKSVEPLAGELKTTGSRLPMVVPDIEENPQSVVWEGKSGVMPKDIGDITLVNARAFLELWEKQNIFALPEDTPHPLNGEMSIDIGLGKIVKIENTTDKALSESVDQIKKAMGQLPTQTGGVEKIKIVTPDEMKSVFLAGLKKKAEEASRILFTETDKARGLIQDIHYGLDMEFSGLYVADERTIYLLADSNFETIQHELAHAAHHVLEEKAALPETSLEEVDQYLWEELKRGRQTISDHGYVKAASRQGTEEWRTDALKTYWTNPEKLLQTDPDLFYFYHLLHNNIIEEEIAEGEATATRYRLEPVNVYQNPDGKQRLQNALDYYRNPPPWLLNPTPVP